MLRRSGRQIRRVIVAAALLVASLALLSRGAAVYRFDGPGRASPSIRSVVERFAGRVDWSRQGQLAMDSQWESGDDFQIWILRPDGSERRPLTKGNAQVGAFSNGNPAWHPDGRHLVFQSADAPAPDWLRRSSGWRALSHPGAGVGNNLWLITADGSRAWRLTMLPANRGVLHPHFSRAGDRLVWAELVQGRPPRWVIRLVDFGFDRAGEPRLTNQRALAPGGMAFYEVHGFLPDDSGLIYSATARSEDYRRLEIYRYDFASDRETLLTDPADGAWDEHAQVSPDGRRIVWMSSQDVPQKEGTSNPLAIRTDWWIMNADGTAKRRLTYFNEPGAPEFRRSWNIASDVAWSPDSREVMGYLQQLTLSVKRARYPGTLVRIAVADGG